MVARFRSPDALAFSKRYGTVRYGKIWFDFRIDGQYFISPGTVQDAIPETSVVVDVRVESMAFLSESILLVYTSTQDIRVLYTQSFINGQYISPPLEIAVTKPNFDEIESRLKLMDVGSAYTK